MYKITTNVPWCQNFRHRGILSVLRGSDQRYSNKKFKEMAGVSYEQIK